MKLAAAFLGVILLTSCSSITVLRTKEMKAVGDDVKSDVKKEVSASTETYIVRMDSLEQVIDSLSLVQKRMKVELSMLSSKIADISDRSDSRHEELLYRLDLLLGKSDKILSKKVVVNGQTVSAPADSAEISAEKMQLLDSLFNTARADYNRGEIKLAYSEFKQIYEDSKTGRIAEDALYWMGVCLADSDKMDKAKIVFARVVKQYPDASKTCAALLKLSNIAALEGDFPLQKQYLQKILGQKSCSDSNEFLQAAEMLEAILNGEKVIPPRPVKPLPDSTATLKDSVAVESSAQTLASPDSTAKAPTAQPESAAPESKPAAAKRIAF